MSAKPIETQPESADSTPGWPNLPGYEVLGELGRGGMGVVYQARHLQLNRIVALKMIRAGSHAEPDELRRFQREAEAAARLQHPNIVQIHKVGEQGGLPYFSLEFCAGGSLEKKLQGTPLPAGAAPFGERAGSASHGPLRASGAVSGRLPPRTVPAT